MNPSKEKDSSVNSTHLNAPLAFRMRPRDLNEYIGQADIVGEGTILRDAISSDDLSSIILYGPAGTGKTSLAQVISKMTSSVFEQLSAVTSGVKQIRAAIGDAKKRLVESNMKTIVFIDEIHRFNKGQQDALLPAVEDNTITLIGATTENPFFEVNSPLISRSKIYVLKPLSKIHLNQILSNAINDKERGLGKLNISFEKKALDHIVDTANGDARIALNGLDLAARAVQKRGSQKPRVSLKLAEEAMGKRAIIYDRAGDAHYDTTSAFIKSLRGGDPDAAIYWLARMIKAGEDPKFIARRMVILASEDIGNADPRALQVAMAAAEAVQFVGLPECRLNLAQAATYLAVAPKSNATIKAIDAALADVEKESIEPVPIHLRDAHYSGAKKLGHGKDYKYPHDHEDGFVEQSYLPKNLEGRIYYRPNDSGLEKSIKEVLLRRKSEKKNKSR